MSAGGFAISEEWMNRVKRHSDLANRARIGGWHYCPPSSCSLWGHWATPLGEWIEETDDLDAFEREIEERKTQIYDYASNRWESA